MFGVREKGVATNPDFAVFGDCGGCGSAASL
jgi:hypothetical protein